MAGSLVHWDGKLLPSLTDLTDKLDRLPILVTAISTGETQLLGVPQLESGTGKNQASAVYDLLREWSLTDKVAGFCFDTTASNTGLRTGACILLEQQLARNVLNLACRHHVYEVILKAVFTSCSGCTNGPDVLLFQRFQKHWSSINKSDYQTGLANVELKSFLEEKRDHLLEFSVAKLNEKSSREDYKEFLEFGNNIPWRQYPEL